jgi:hypothetical protein
VSSRRPGRWAWTKLRLRVLERDHHRCVYCGAPATEVDHVIPFADGGPSTMSNCVASCRPCNRRGPIAAKQAWLRSVGGGGQGKLAPPQAICLCCGERHIGPECPDGLVMCCICFMRVEKHKLAIDDGDLIDVCQLCMAQERRVQNELEAPED